MRLRPALLTLLLPVAGACGFSANASGPADASPDTTSKPTVDAELPLIYGKYLKISFPSTGVPTVDLTIKGKVTIDTDATPSTTVTQACYAHDLSGKYCVVAAANLTIDSSAAIRTRGSLPLVFVATKMLQINGSVDVSSVLGFPAGAGSSQYDSGVCTSSQSATEANGGEGGSFQTLGGIGGDSQPRDGKGGIQGQPVPIVTSFPTTLRGGCPGGNSTAASSDLNSAGHGGVGGGVVAFISPTIAMNDGSSIDASGAGGHAGIAGRSGGGGGGAGGMIVIESYSIPFAVHGKVMIWANGGGGGRGGFDNGGPAGSTAGPDGSESGSPTQRGAGSNLGTGQAGDGSLGMEDGRAPSGTGAILGDSGSGGGGGAGFIYAPGITDPNMISPPTSLMLPTSP